MFGVVLWSDTKDGKAVFWCEDQGDLAYFETAPDTIDTTIGFDAGDMVQFDVSVEQRLRRASNARVVKEQAYTGLPETLRESATTAAFSSADPKVVPLHSFQQPARAVQETRSKRKA